MWRLVVLVVLGGVAAVPAEAAFPFAPPETVIAETYILSTDDPFVPSTVDVVFACTARAAKEAKLTKVTCTLTDSSGSAPLVKENIFTGPFSAAGAEAGGIIRPAEVCTTAWALYEVDGHATEVTDNYPCRPI